MVGGGADLLGVVIVLTLLAAFMRFLQYILHGSQRRRPDPNPTRAMSEEI